ncbi:hypothetical protein JMA_27470 [Jeotgalibacillus malaysiensis]|uniref:DUF771 domain-containing protein n=1 Tax=Jeotgalibacillus malaysiensis TaxID=1508404 RepID=A0A0B5AVN4_9BACL|nr:DUF771 domain-containing protein [Jeotgalibacillus malaysiensis]AJD92064.1 hypothetical protein JMA_27470 [Jeotgalibacillus malaysiensis]
MNQQFSVQVSIPVPEHLIIIEKTELKRLQDAELHGQWWSMKDLEDRTGRKAVWLKENVLSRFRKDLDVDNGGFVYYPKVKGETYVFHAEKMNDFLDKYFSVIFNKG